jgi:SAM-dependent methyltransferase
MNSSRVYLERFAAAAARSLPAGATMLDAGAGSAPYRPLFGHVRYESADFEQVPGKRYEPSNHVCDLAAIPVEDDRYDLVLLNQVLEHLPEPKRVLVELRRVLRPGGTIWASMPLFYEEHDVPYDFYRYTQYGLRYLFGEAGFQRIEIDWLEGYLGTLSYEAQVAARAVPGRPLRWGLRQAAEVLARADLRRKVTAVGHPKNYTLVASA